MGKIKKLDKNLINQIAAGEVIDRPSAVVKELVENSIDAGATKIEVEIKNECRNIRVADNGSGISADDIELAFAPHATSKISIQEDLWNISTLGFRGEALASIISVSKVICTSRTASDEVGTKVECKNSEIKKTQIGCAVGTIMEVQDLFYNTPVRLKFLKSDRSEYSNIIEMLQNIAISHPEASITLKNEKATSLKTSGSGDLKMILTEIYSDDLINQLKPINKTDTLSNLKITGYASLPSFTRSNKKAVYLFVNGRVVKCPVLLKAISFAYEELIPRGKHPFVAINLDLPKDELDVNVHPTKREIRYQNGNQVFNFVHSAIKQAIEFAPRNEEMSLVSNYASSENFRQGKESIDFASFKEQVSYTPKFYKPLEAQFVQKNFEIQQEFEFEQEQNQSDYRIIGQFKNTYILLETKDGLQIIDQHIAHERYLYEELLEQNEINSQLILVASPIKLEPSEIAVLEENHEILQKYGYKIEFPNSKEVIFRKLPQIVANKNHKEILEDLLQALEGSIEKIGNEILISMACHGAIKANEALSFYQIDDLLKKWMKTKNPTTCPHGRIIAHTFDGNTIAGFFGRAK
ncbi:MAG: DNA mismatch repair endonuclease MutL [bacterium]